MILIRNRLNAGFFSNLNAALGWYWYSMRTEIPIHVFWNGVNNFTNVFDIFYQQKFPYQPHDFVHDANVQHSSMFTDQIKEAWKEDIGETIYNKYDNGWFFCQGLLYTEPDFNHLRQLYNYIYTENLKFYCPLDQPKLPENTMGVNYRFLRFYYTNDGKRIPWHTFMSVEEYHKKYMEQIESAFENGKYDHIYVASSQQGFLDLCSEKFKDKLLSLPMKRIGEHQTEFERGVSLIEEYTNVLKDVNNLINCRHLVISPSNLIFGVLYLNPNITFDVFDFLKQTNTD